MLVQLTGLATNVIVSDFSEVATTYGEVVGVGEGWHGFLTQR